MFAKLTSQGGSTYPWSDARVIALFVVFGVLTLIFILVQWRQQENGTVPPRIFLMRSVLSATWFAFMFGGSFFILIYYVPIWFQYVSLSHRPSKPCLSR